MRTSPLSTCLLALLGVALATRLLANEPRSYACSVANPSRPPDQVASMIMQKPIYPIAVHAVAFSPDGRILASGDGTVRLRLWDPATGNLIRDRRAHSNWVSGVAFSPDGRQLASSSGFKLRVFEVASGKEIWPTDFRGVIRGQAGGDTAEDLSTVVFSSDGTTIAVGATNGSVYLVSVNCGELLRQLSLPKE